MENLKMSEKQLKPVKLNYLLNFKGVRKFIRKNINEIFIAEAGMYYKGNKINTKVDYSNYQTINYCCEGDCNLDRLSSDEDTKKDDILIHILKYHPHTFLWNMKTKALYEQYRDYTTDYDKEKLPSLFK